MANLGLLAGLAKGLESGLQSYQGARKLRAEQDLAEKKLLADQEDRALKREDLLFDRNLKEKTQAESLEEKRLARETNEALRREQMDLSRSNQRDSLDLKRELMTDRKERDREKREQANQTFKQNQYLAAGYGQRVADAEKAFDELSSGGFDRADRKQGLLSSLPDFAQFGDTRRQTQAERNFLTAQLRRESGAAISPSEFSVGEKLYFPRAGDTPELLAEKKRNREAVLAALMAEAGGAYGQVSQKREALSSPSISRPQEVSPPKVQAPRGSLSGEDLEALQWAQANPRDPRSAQILKRLGR